MSVTNSSYYFPINMNWGLIAKNATIAKGAIVKKAFQNFPVNPEKYNFFLLVLFIVLVY